MTVGSEPSNEFRPIRPINAGRQSSVPPEVRNHQHNYIVVLRRCQLLDGWAFQQPSGRRRGAPVGIAPLIVEGQPASTNCLPSAATGSSFGTSTITSRIRLR